LPHVGNDVVDLTQSTAKKKSRNIRFLNRVFTPEEQSSILSSPFPDLRLWSCWAAKEAAYKAISKAYPDIPSIPKLFPVLIDSEDPADYNSGPRRSSFPLLRKGSVLTPGGKCWIRIDYRYTYLHCIAFTAIPDQLDFSWRVHYLFSSLQKTPSLESEAVRIASRFHLAGFLSENFDDLKISRQHDGHSQTPPQVFCQGRLLDVDISLSHDGFFIAHACLGGRQ